MLAVIAVIGDRVAEHLAEGKVATVARDKESLPTEPEVEFEGFPFLTQVLGNDISEVRMSLPAVEARAGDTEQIRVEDVAVAFLHVRTSDSFRQATADQMTGSATIPYDEVSDLGPFTASYGGQGGQGVGVITLTPDEGEGPPAGLSFDVGVAVNDGSLPFLGTDGTTRIAPIPKDLRPALSRLIEVPLGLYGLPKSFTIDSLEVTKDGFDLDLSGSNVELTR